MARSKPYVKQMQFMVVGMYDMEARRVDWLANKHNATRAQIIRLAIIWGLRKRGLLPKEDGSPA